MAPRTSKPAQFLEHHDDITDVHDEYEVMSPPEAQQTAAKKSFDDLLSDLSDTSDSAEVRVYRQNIDGKSGMTYIMSCPPDKFTMPQLLEHLRLTFGGGDYRVHLRGNGGIVANKLFQIASPIQPPGASPIGEAGSIVNSVLAEMQRMQQLMMSHLTAKRDDEDAEERMLNKMMRYRELFGGGNPSGVSGGISQIRETLEVLGSLGINVGGLAQEDKPSRMERVLESSLPALLALMTRKNVNIAPPNMGGETYHQNPVEDESMQIQQGLILLVGAARKNGDPGTYAQMVIDQIGEEKALATLQDTHAIQRMLTEVPEIAQYRPWFELLIEHIKAQLGLDSSVSSEYVDNGE